MAVSPILLNKLPVDAEKSITLLFTYSGSQIFANRVVIRDNVTNRIIYDVKTSSMSANADVPKNTLQNGKSYNFQVSVFDKDNNESPLSNIVVLKCLKTPHFDFADLHDGMTIRNS